MITEKQLEANRQNAKLGGVKTKEGKAISRRNAIKHGLLSEEVLLKGEKEELLIELGKRLRTELKPESELELLLTDRIVANIWRLKRAMRIEREMIEEERKEMTSKGLGWVFNNYDFDRYNTHDKFIRYEASIERGIYKALHELQRIQSARAGEKPLAPVAIDIDVTSDK